MADSRTTLLILILLTYFLFANDGTVQIRAGLAREAAENTIKEAYDFLKRVQETNYGDINSLWAYSGFNGSNSTVFSHVRQYDWASLSQVQARARERSAYALGEWGVAALEGRLSDDDAPLLYTNITGDARGRWIRSKLASEDRIPALNFSEFTVEGPFGPVKHNRFDANFTGAAGDVSIDLLQKGYSPEFRDGNITTITAEIDITEDGTEQREMLLLRGVQYTQLGMTVLTTTTLKFPGIFALPMFALSEPTHNMSRVLLNQTISQWLQQTDNAVNPWRPDSSDTQNVLLKCELIVYLQQMPIVDTRSAFVTRLDDELRFPTGAPRTSVPDMRFSMLAYSPDCGYILESEGPPDQAREIAEHLVGRKSGMLLSRARHHMLLYGVVVAFQLILLVRQMREASTPSTRSRVSFYSIAMIVFSDAFATMNFITVSLFIDSLWITILGSASFALVNILIFGMRFMSDIWAVHAPELQRREQEAREASIAAAQERQDTAIRSAREQQQAAYDQTTGTPIAAAPLRSAPQVVDFGSLPVFMPSDQAGLQPAGDRPPASRVPTFGSLYMRFSLSLIMVLIVSVSAVSWSGTLRYSYFTLLSFFHVSVWIPQILRNIQRNCRKALKWEFVVGQSVLRILPIAYVFGLENNVLNAKPHRITLAVIACWLWLQVVLLVSQEIVGPRWLVKKDWAPQAWDYHPILRSDLEDSALPLGLADSVSLPASPTERRGSLPKDNKSNGRRVFDCAICMQELEVPVVDAKDGVEVSAAASGSLMLARRQYMVTPCRHIFHSNCLEGWMKYRLQCPICREGLPPL